MKSYELGTFIIPTQQMWKLSLQASCPRRPSTWETEVGFELRWLGTAPLPSLWNIWAWSTHYTLTQLGALGVKDRRYIHDGKAKYTFLYARIFCQCENLLEFPCSVHTRATSVCLILWWSWHHPATAFLGGYFPCCSVSELRVESGE